MRIVGIQAGGACIGLLLFILTFQSICMAKPELSDQVKQPFAGIEPKLGELVPLDLTFYDEEGQPVILKDLIDGPTAITLVYYRCPGICNPLLNEMSSVMDKVVNEYDMIAGKDYRHLTISFDPLEKDIKDLAKNKRTAMMKQLKHSIDPSGWRFLTGDAENIKKITEAVGFGYIPNNQDFTHKGAVIFLTKEGKVVCYLDGGVKVSSMSQNPKPNILPMEVKLALVDASEGNVRNLFKKLQGLCYQYNAENKSYSIKVNRIILGFGVLTILGFGSVLAFGKGRQKSQAELNRKLNLHPTEDENKNV